jgi:predicted nucleotidyltransferase
MAPVKLANEQAPAAQATAAQFGLPERSLRTLRGILASQGAVEQAIVYGSRAQGNFGPGSDIDLTLVGPALTLRHLAFLAQALDESDLPYQVDLSLREHIDNPNLLEHIARVGQVLYERPGHLD